MKIVSKGMSPSMHLKMQTCVCLCATVDGACLCVLGRACAHVCVRACVRACVFAWLRACVMCIDLKWKAIRKMGTIAYFYLHINLLQRWLHLTSVAFSVSQVMHFTLAYLIFGCFEILLLISFNLFVLLLLLFFYSISRPPADYGGRSVKASIFIFLFRCFLSWCWFFVLVCIFQLNPNPNQRKVKRNSLCMKTVSLTFSLLTYKALNA